MIILIISPTNLKNLAFLVEKVGGNTTLGQLAKIAGYEVKR